MEEVLARLQAVVRFTDELERRFGDAGLGSSLGDVLALYRMLATTLESIPAVEIARVMDETRTLMRGLAGIERALDEMKRLKARLT